MNEWFNITNAESFEYLNLYKLLYDLIDFLMGFIHHTRQCFVRSFSRAKANQSKLWLTCTKIGSQYDQFWHGMTTMVFHHILPRKEGPSVADGPAFVSLAVFDVLGGHVKLQRRRKKCCLANSCPTSFIDYITYIMSFIVHRHITSWS